MQVPVVDDNTAEAVKRITRGAIECIARFAFEHLRTLGRKKLTIAHKSSVLKMTDAGTRRMTEAIVEKLAG